MFLVSDTIVLAQQGMLAAAKDFVLGAVRATPPAAPVAVAAAVRSYEISPYRWTHHIRHFITYTAGLRQHCNPCVGQGMRIRAAAGGCLLRCCCLTNAGILGDSHVLVLWQVGL
jgi:hypothetical protein